LQCNISSTDSNWNETLSGIFKVKIRDYKNISFYYREVNVCEIYYYPLQQPIDSITYNNIAAANITGLAGDFNTMQISILLGYDLVLSDDMNIVPYGGITYSQFEYESQAGSFTAGGTINQAAQSLDSDDVLGFIAGLSLKMGNNLDVNLEGRFVAESAFSIGFNYRF